MQARSLQRRHTHTQACVLGMPAVLSCLTQVSQFTCSAELLDRAWPTGNLSITAELPPAI